jgi:hypothetical protein
MIRRLSVFKPIGVLVAAIALLSTSLISPAFAATSSSTGAGNGMKVSPVHTELSLKPGQSTTVDVYITNVTSQAATFQAIINDFVASGDETGNPAIILNPDQSAPSHGLKKYIKPISNVTLQPGEQADVKAIITLPADVAPGGYYGAIRFAPASGGAATNISLSASVASLILVRVAGEVKEQVSIASFDARSDDKSRSIFTSNKNIDGTIRFQNNGNVQEQPFGKIILKKGSKIISSSEVNNTDPRGNVLPDSIRKFSVPLSGIGSFGKYRLEGNFGYGSDGQLLTATATFYVIPIPVIVTVLVSVALIIALVFEVPRMIKRYNRRILRQAGR